MILVSIYRFCSVIYTRCTTCWFHDYTLAPMCVIDYRDEDEDDFQVLMTSRSKSRCVICQATVTKRCCSMPKSARIMLYIVCDNYVTIMDLCASRDGFISEHLCFRVDMLMFLMSMSIFLMFRLLIWIYHFLLLEKKVNCIHTGMVVCILVR